MAYLIDDDSHFTIDIKITHKVQNSTHFTFHAHLGQILSTPELNNLWDVDAVRPKINEDNKLKIEKDNCFDCGQEKKELEKRLYTNLPIQT